MFDLLEQTDIDINELFYLRIDSSSWLQDALYLYIYIPYAICCVLLNLLTLFLLQSRIVQITTLNNYIKVYTFTSLLVCFSLLFKGIVSAPRYSSFSFSYSARIYLCHIYIISACVLVFVANSLNIIIIIERLSMFVIKYRKYHTKNPFVCSIYLYFISIMINLIIYFQQEAKDENAFNLHRNNLTLLLNLERCDTTKFGQSSYVKMGVVFSFLIGNFVLLII